MLFSTSILLLALSASAAPLGGKSHKWSSSNSTSTTSGASSTQVPFIFPPNPTHFPTPSAQELITIEEQAGGTLSDAPPPPFPGQDGITNLQLIAFNELFEVAFFTDLIHNITHHVSNYEVENFNLDRDYVLEALKAIQKQEMLHEQNANTALAHFNVTPVIQPCEYIFPVEDFGSAIALAATFTDLVMGTLQDVQQIFAGLNDTGLVRGIGSVIGNEGEQEGFFRILQKKNPSSAPFLTTSTRDFAFTALQSFVVNGSCPNINNNEIPLKIFGGLNIENAQDLQAKNGTAMFSVNPKQGDIDSSSTVVYISGQNEPVSVPIKNFQLESDIRATFEASFPFEGDEDATGRFNDGLTIVAVVSGDAQFGTADQVAKVAKFGPGLVEIK